MSSNNMFLLRNKKNINTFWTTKALTGAMCKPQRGFSNEYLQHVRMIQISLCIFSPLRIFIGHTVLNRILLQNHVLPGYTGQRALFGLLKCSIYNGVKYEGHSISIWNKYVMSRFFSSFSLEWDWSRLIYLLVQDLPGLIFFMHKKVTKYLLRLSALLPVNVGIC